MRSIDFSSWDVNRLRRALEDGEFRLQYQPKVDLFTSRIRGAETLIRYVDTQGNRISPSRFISRFEKNGLISLLTQWVCQQSVCFIERLLPQVGQDFRLSFNVSAYDLQHAQFIRALNDSLLGKEYLMLHLTLELTEDGLRNLQQPIIDELIELRDRGLALSMDDFGTAYSGIERLSRIPFTEIKIDRSFISQIGNSDIATRIVDATVAMAHYLGLETVAEGIETREQLDVLRNIGCEIGQGYYFAPPLDEETFLEKLQIDLNGQDIPIGFISQAILNHVRWHRNYVCNLHRLHKAVQEKIRPQLDFPLSELNHEECRLGRWILEHQRELENADVLALIDEPHRKLHDFADRLWRSVVRGQEDSWVFSQLQGLSSLSQRLVSALYEVEHLMHSKQLRA